MRKTSCMGMNLAFVFAYLRSKEQICLQMRAQMTLILPLETATNCLLANKYLDYSWYQTEDTKLGAESYIVAVFSVLLKPRCFLHIRSILNSQEFVL